MTDTFMFRDRTDTAIRATIASGDRPATNPDGQSDPIWLDLGHPVDPAAAPDGNAVAIESLQFQAEAADWADLG